MSFDATRRTLMLGTGAAGLALFGIYAPAQPAERIIKIVARKFEYEPDKIMLRVGEPVLLELTSPEVLMGFSAYELGLRSDIPPGRVTPLRFTPSKPGNFEFSCDVFCGSGHEEMSGVIIVSA